MKDITEGIFFDGVSSKPNKVFISFNSAHTSLLFHAPAVASTEWKLTDLTPDVVAGKMTIHHKGGNNSSLIIEDNLFRENFFNHFNRKGAGVYQRLIHAGAAVHIGLVLLMLGLLAASYFYFVPWLAERAVDIVPSEYDAQLGNMVFQNFITTVEVDSEKTKYANEFADKIRFHADKKLKFTVVKSKEINAFALPDGNVVIYTGILDKMHEYPQLAALMGHEAAHYIKRHSMRSLCRSISGYILISVITTDVNAIMAVLADNANQLNNLSFSRSFESEADKTGFEILTANKIDPKGMLDLFGILKSSESFQMPQFLSTHPMTTERIDETNKMINNIPFSVIDDPELKQIFSHLSPGN